MRDFYKHIQLKYNTETCKTLKYYGFLLQKLSKRRSKLKFLLTCQQYSIIPPHINNITKKLKSLYRTDYIQQDFEKTSHNFAIRLIKLEIRQSNIEINALNNKIKATWISIKNILTEDEYNNVRKRQINSYKHSLKLGQKSYSSKLEKLHERKKEKLGIIFNKDWFVNLTKINIQEDIQWLLSLGKKFAIPIDHSNFSPIHTIADIEQGIQTIEDEKEKHIARAKFATKISVFKRKIKQTEREKYILTIYKLTQKFLKKHKDDLIITTSDKGNKTVVMYKTEYNTKMNQLLEDKNTYKITRLDPTHKLQKSNNTIITELFKTNQIDLQLKLKLHSSAANAPRLYGLPKIHKANLPLRPISSSVNVPCYALSKHIGSILKHVISDDYNIKNSTQLKQKLEKIKLDKDDTLISLDVVSLFTNIPIYLAIKNIMEKWEKIQQHTNINKQKFLQILNFCLRDNNYFRYMENTYIQTFGMPMGNPLSPTIADIILDKLLDETISKLKEENIHLKFLVKYVDDIFAIVNKKDLNTILTAFNKYHNKLQFTMEIESNNTIPYLDMYIIKSNNTIITNWYSKPTSSGRIQNFLSSQPKNQKINTAWSFINRVLDISHRKFIPQNIEKIKTILNKNSYPKNLINTLLQKKQCEQNSTKIQNNENETEKQNYCSIRYISGLTNKQNLKNIFNNDTIIPAYKPNKTLNTVFTNTKSKIDKLQQNNLVYEIKCLGNNEQQCGKVYIGTTKRSLETRIKEHDTDIKKQKETTALAQHMIMHKHTADLAGVSILDKERRSNTRYTIESLRIQQKIVNTINYKEDTDNINHIYSFAL